MHVRQVRYHSPGTEGPRVMHAVFSPHSRTKTSAFRISYIYLFPASLPEPTGLLPRLLLFARGSTCLLWGDFGGGGRTSLVGCCHCAGKVWTLEAITFLPWPPPRVYLPVCSLEE